MITRRAALTGAASALALPALADHCRVLPRGVGLTAAGATISPDGSVINGINNGGTGVLRTAYGVWDLRSTYAPAAFGAGDFNEVYLNGFPVFLDARVIAPQRLRCGQLRVDFGGRLFGVTFDQIWFEWAVYVWAANGGADFASGPAATPVYGGLPNYNPPYTPSSENTSISGGTGSLQTVDGLFTFGGAHDGGFDPVLNGLPIGGPGRFAVDQMTVYGHSQMFFHFAGGGPWYCWAGRQFNPSTGPSAAPVPINITFSPSASPVISSSATLGTLIATIAVTMSDGSGFSGTLAIDAGTDVALSGANLITNATPFSSAPNLGVTATQGGVTYASAINIAAV